MARNRISQLVASVTGLLLACGIGLNANTVNAADTRDGKFDLQYISGPLKGKSSTGLFQYEESPLFYDGYRIVRINEGLIFLEFAFEKQKITHEDDLLYPYTPQIQLVNGYPVGLELHLGEGVINVSKDTILNLNLLPNNQVSYNLKNDTNESIEFGEGVVNNIQIIGVFIGAGVVVLAAFRIASLVKEKIANDSKDLATKEEHSFAFRIC